MFRLATISRSTQHTGTSDFTDLYKAGSGTFQGTRIDLLATVQRSVLKRFLSRLCRLNLHFLPLKNCHRFDRKTSTEQVT